MVSYSFPAQYLTLNQTAYFRPSANKNTMADKKNNFFFQVPNFIDYANLRPRAYRLYGHLRKCCGTNKTYWDESQERLAQSCSMSKNTVREAISDLEKAGLIRIEEIGTPSGICHRTHLIDVWDLNQKVFDGSIVAVTDDTPIIRTAKEAYERRNQGGKRRRTCRLPEEFEITMEMEAWALEHIFHIDIYEETEHFKTIMEFERRADWDSVWRRVMLAMDVREARKTEKADQLSY
jgi:Helix-turn-helix domain